MTDSIWPTIHAERRALADDLASLTPARWGTQSLCGEWTVHQALAHLVSAAKMTPPRFVSRFAGLFCCTTYCSRQRCRPMRV